MNRGRTTRSNREFDLSRGRNNAVRNGSSQRGGNRNSAVRGRGSSRVFAENRTSSMAQSRVNPNARNTQAPNNRPTQSNENNRNVSRGSAQAVPPVNTTRPVAQTVAPSNTAKNFKIKRRSRPTSGNTSARPSNNTATQKSFKSENAAQRSFNAPSFQSTRPMSAPRNYSRPSSGRGSGGRGGRG